MTQQIIATGSTANDGTGDTLRSAGTKINANFSELYANIYTLPTAQPPANNLGIPFAGRLGGVIPDGTTITITNGVISAISTAASAGALTGTTLKSTVVSSSLTSVGILTDLTVSGTTTLSTSLNGLLKGTNGVVSSAVAGTDYLVRGSLSVTVATNSGSGNLTYSNGIFTFTPPLIPNYTVTTAAASGAGSLSISGTTFTYTPYSLQPATTLTLGGVRVDGTSIVVNGSGIISTNLSGTVVFKGTWNASTNTPTLTSGVGTQGWQYAVNVSGTQDLGNGSQTYNVGDFVIYDGTNWIDISGTTGVSTFNTRAGAVTLSNNDVITALGFTPYNSTNPSSYLTGISQSQVISALGFTPIQSSDLTITTNVASGSGSLSYSSGVFTFTPYALPTATTTVLGGVKIDNSTININNGVISVSSALTSATQFKGNWDATNNSPLLGGSLPSGVVAGWEYIVSTAGTRDIGNGGTAYSIGDLVIYDGSKWVRIPGGNAVTSFNTRQGAITLSSSDVTTALGGTQNANKILAGPSTGADAIPTFRALVAADIPALSYVSSSTSQTQNYVFAAPNGSTGTPTFRALVAADIPTLTGYITTSSTGQTITDTSGTTNYSFKIANGTTGAIFAVGTGSDVYGIANDMLNHSVSGYVPYAVSASTVTFKTGASSPATALSIAANGAVTIGTLAGLLKGTSGVISAAAASDINSTFGSQTQNYVYAAPGGAAGNPTFRALVNADLPSTITATAATATLTSTAASLGYLGLPQSATATTATLAIGDAGKHIYVTTTGQTITIPAASSVAYPIGTTITFIAGSSATTVSIAIASDTLRLAGSTNTGTRTLAANGMATAVKVAGTSSAGVWYINGTGLT